MKNILLVVIASLLSAFIAVTAYRQVVPIQQVIIREATPATFASDKNSTAITNPKRHFLSSTPADFIASANAATPAVVFIESSISSNNFWGRESYGSSTGSGVIISNDGYIATNNHVIEDGKQITVTLNDNREFKAKVLGTDPTTDLALLKIEAKNLEHVEFGNSDSVSVGEWVLAVGNPFRLQSTVTAGIVSAKARNINILQDQAGIESFIQTDAAVNPGNSGGALVNTNGELIGINTAIITYSGQYEGFSFAIPSNLARKVLTDLREFGKVRRGWLGVEITPITDGLAKELGLKKVAGILLQKVIVNGAAEESGLKPNDVLISVDGIETNSTPQFMELVGQFRPGDEIEIGYYRKGKLQSTKVILGERQNTILASSSDDAIENAEIMEDLGFAVRDLTEEEKTKLKSDGVMVERIFRGSKIARTNMEENYIITEINGKEINDKNQLVSELNRQSGMIVLKGFYEKFPGEYPYAFNKD
jgi:Do/DeqQ family serine protease